MEKISCILVDDEPLALDLLERYVLKTPFLDLRYRCNSAVQAMEFLEDNPVDLIFLDIQMPELSGLELSRIVDKNTRIIFTTAFNEYALEGFRVNAIDYLLKPFNFDEFLRAVNKAREWFDLTKNQGNAGNTAKDFIFIRSEYRQIKIMLCDVIFFEGLKDYVKVWVTDSSKPWMTILSLKSLEKELPSATFMRIHRSYIIALDKIQSVERGQVIMNDKTRITVAEQYREKFQHFISGRLIS